VWTKTSVNLLGKWIQRIQLGELVFHCDKEACSLNKKTYSNPIMFSTKKKILMRTLDEKRPSNMHEGLSTKGYFSILMLNLDPIPST